MLFLTSDTHFGHANVVKHDGQFLPSHITTVEERDELIVEQWNKTVGVNDEVWHLGDFMFRATQSVEWYRNRLNGKINLVFGNHDDEKIVSPFQSVQHYKYLKWNKRKIVLCHYPMMSWRGSNAGSWMLHGHTHGSIVDDGRSRRLDIGIMCHEYRPWSFDEVAEWMEQEGRRDTNHH